MNFRDSLLALRRRSPFVVAAIVLGAAAGWFTAPGEAADAGTFEATHTLIYEPNGTQSYNIEQIALLATSGAVPTRVAARVGTDRLEVRSVVSAVADADVSTISISAQSPDADRAVVLADVTAQELSVEMDGRSIGTYESETNRLTAAVDSVRQRLGRMRGPVERDAAQRDLQTAEQALARHQEVGPPKLQLRTLESATASAVHAKGLEIPRSKGARTVLGGLLGLLIGLAGAIAHARLDTRIRSKSVAEQAFGAPVVTEVPRIPKSGEGELLTRTQPSSPFVEAYRGLRTYVALWAPETGEEDGHRVIAVTSPGAGEGKTTTVAHLAAMLAEIGRSVIVVSADLRRPRIHQYFDRSGVPGLVDVLSGGPGAPGFGDLDLSTSVRGVRLVASGPPLENPGPILEQAAELLSVARRMADFVLVDCPPLLVANDAIDLARHADGVLLVTRSGRTPIEAAERSAEMLQRLEIPIVGAVLVGSEAASNGSRYYRDRYYIAPEHGGKRRRRREPSHPEVLDSSAPVAAPRTTMPPAGEKSDPAAPPTAEDTNHVRVS